MWLRHALIGAELRSIGIDANCAPCADIAGPDTHPFLKNRCYGTTASAVARLSRAVADGLMAGGCLPVLKHLPGHGRATADSHLHLPRVTAGRAELAASDFAPFAALSDLPLAMTAHIVFPAIDATAPATCSAAMIALIRDEIGFGGLLMTDDISMGALSGSLADRAEQSLAAGCDLILHCNGDLAEMQEVAAASGSMSAAAEARGQVALARRPAAPHIDIACTRAEFLALTGQAEQ
jgi:beta-N-acetylhexosaminidase